MATFDLGRVTPLYKGDYSASASYELNDVVLYNGNLYWHVQATATVGILPTDTTVWKLAFADEGVRAEIRGYADNAQASADSALASKSAAATSASNASASASQAAQSAQTAQTAETGATASAQTASTKASEASASAQAAASSAQTATDKATLASQKAVAASESATLATAKAQAAATSETNAVTAANTATTKASEAAASATSAQEYDESAQQSAVNAQTSATNAATLAASAQGYSEAAAQSAEDAAESASRAEAFYYLPTDTAEGAIATFTDGADNVPVKSLVVGINPVQSGEGDPSPTNVRPIDGWTGMTVNANGTEIPISWESEAGTVYGGSLDVTNGVLTVDMVMVDLGTLSWHANTNITQVDGTPIPVFRSNIGAIPSKINSAGLSSQYIISPGSYANGMNNIRNNDNSAWVGCTFWGQADARVVLRNDTYTDAEEFKTAMSGVQLVYELATPVTYQLTPTKVKSLLGQNNIWADTGDTTVEYRADTSAYIAKKIAEAISALS